MHRMRKGEGIEEMQETPREMCQGESFSICTSEHYVPSTKAQSNYGYKLNKLDS